MDEIKEFLQKEDCAMEARRYRNKARERNEIDSIMQDIEREENIKKEMFKNALKKMGVNLIEGKEKEKEANELPREKQRENI